MSTLDEQVQQLKDTHADATRARVRAEHERDAANARLTQARARLAEEFGVHTHEQGKTLLTQLHQSLNEAIDEARTALRESTGAS